MELAQEGTTPPGRAAVGQGCCGPGLLWAGVAMGRGCCGPGLGFQSLRLLTTHLFLCAAHGHGAMCSQLV